jgi:hypothetical protein
MRYAETAAEAYRIAKLPTSAERHAALAAVPAEFQSLVRETAICLRAVPLHWRKGLHEGRIAPESVPPLVRDALAEFFPGEFPST